MSGELFPSTSDSRKEGHSGLGSAAMERPPAVAGNDAASNLLTRAPRRTMHRRDSILPKQPPTPIAFLSIARRFFLPPRLSVPVPVCVLYQGSLDSAATTEAFRSWDAARATRLLGRPGGSGSTAAHCCRRMCRHSIHKSFERGIVIMPLYAMRVQWGPALYIHAPPRSNTCTLGLIHGEDT